MTLSLADIEALEALEASMAPAPWSVTALHAGIRHLERNTGVMQDALDVLDEGDGEKTHNTPDRYDGDALAKLRNALPALLAIARANAVAV